MAKFYKVELYDVYRDKDFNNYQSLGKIIIKAGMFGSYKDILTGYEIVGVFGGEEEFLEYARKAEIPPIGHIFVLFEASITKENLATSSDIDEYVDGYDNSKWKPVYEDMKKYSEEISKKAINKKVKSIYGSKA